MGSFLFFKNVLGATQPLRISILVGLWFSHEREFGHGDGTFAKKRRAARGTRQGV